MRYICRQIVHQTDEPVHIFPVLWGRPLSSILLGSSLMSSLPYRVQNNTISLVFMADILKLNMRPSYLATYISHNMTLSRPYTTTSCAIQARNQLSPKGGSFSTNKASTHTRTGRRIFIQKRRTIMLTYI